MDVDDIDAALEKINALGGSTVLPRQDVGGMGWSAYFKDTEGNVVGLWQNAAPADAAADAPAGRGGRRERHRRLRGRRPGTAACPGPRRR